jgi:hypothetical protein
VTFFFGYAFSKTILQFFYILYHGAVLNLRCVREYNGRQHTVFKHCRAVECRSQWPRDLKILFEHRGRGSGPTWSMGVICVVSAFHLSCVCKSLATDGSPRSKIQKPGKREASRDSDPQCNTIIIIIIIIRRRSRSRRIKALLVNELFPFVFS